MNTQREQELKDSVASWDRLLQEMAALESYIVTFRRECVRELKNPDYKAPADTMLEFGVLSLAKAEKLNVSLVSFAMLMAQSVDNRLREKKIGGK